MMLTPFQNKDGRAVRRVLAGRTEEFGRLVERYLERAHAIAYAHMRNTADAEDVATGRAKVQRRFVFGIARPLISG